MLAGSRMALANEIEAGSRLSAQTVKVAVSTEHITARQLYGAPFTFAPTHKLLIRGNHRPIITDDDEGIWRRILLVPFNLDVPAADRDAGLEAKLLAEAPGILRWLVEGFDKWQRDGLKPAKRVTDASLNYRKESDLLMQWVAEQCETGATFTVPQREAYGAYRGWCSEQGVRQFSKASFTRGLAERGFGDGREGEWRAAAPLHRTEVAAMNIYQHPRSDPSRSVPLFHAFPKSPYRAIFQNRRFREMPKKAGRSWTATSQTKPRPAVWGVCGKSLGSPAPGGLHR